MLPFFITFSCASEIVPNCDRKINPSYKLALIGEATCETCPPQTVTYKWIILVLNSTVWEEVPDQTGLVSTPLDSRMLAVKPGVLMGGYKYRFRLESQVANGGNVKGFSAWEKEVNEAPEPGVCEVTPQLGCAFCSVFTIGCTGWIDDTKLKYRVGVRLDCDAAELPVSSTVSLPVGQSYNLTSITLPLGLAKHDFRVDVIITISDEDDASTQVIVTVQVRLMKFKGIFFYFFIFFSNRVKYLNLTASTNIKESLRIEFRFIYSLLLHFVLKCKTYVGLKSQEIRDFSLLFLVILTPRKSCIKMLLPHFFCLLG